MVTALLVGTLTVAASSTRRLWHVGSEITIATLYDGWTNQKHSAQAQKVNEQAGDGGTMTAGGIQITRSSREGLRLPSYITAMAWSNERRLLAVAYDWGRSIRVFDDQNHIVSEIRGEYANINNALAFIEDGRMLVSPAMDKGSAVTDAMLSVWDVDTGSLIRDIPGPVPEGAWRPNRAIAISAADQAGVLAVLAGTLNNTLLSLDVKTLHVVSQRSAQQVNGTARHLFSLAVSPSGKWIASGYLKDFFLLVQPDAGMTAKRIEAFLAPDPPFVGALSFNPTSDLIAAGAGLLTQPGPAMQVLNVPPLDHFVGVWTVPGGEFISKLPLNVTPVKSLSWSKGGQYLAVAGGGRSICIWKPSAQGQGDVGTFSLQGSAVGVEWLDDDAHLAIAAGVDVVFATVAPSSIEQQK